MTDNRPPPDPDILELARVIARRMAREDAAKGIRRVWEIPRAFNAAQTQSAICETPAQQQERQDPLP